MRQRTNISAAFGLLVGLVCLAQARPASAQDLTVGAELSDRAVAQGDEVTLSVRVIAKVEGGIQLDVPQVRGLTELSRSRSEGTSISWTGAGQSITRELTVAIQYRADLPGDLTVPPITAQVGATTARSAQVTLRVGAEDEVVAEVPGAGQVVPPAGDESQLFLRYRVDKPKVWLGEQILLDLEIFVSPNLNFGIEQTPPPPELDGFWREMLYQPQTLQRRIERVHGQTYHVYRVWRMALFPLEAGTVTIPAIQITFSQNRSIFGGGRSLRRKTVPLELEVKPLPREGRPAGFAGVNVGSFGLLASVDHQSVPAGKAVLLKIVLRGQGNLRNAKLPELTTIPGFRVFPPTARDDVQLGLDGVSGEKSVEILLMPEKGGRLEVPSVALPVFDPAKGEYVRLTTDSIRIAVEGQPDPAGLGAPIAVGPKAELPDAQEPSRVARERLHPLRFLSKLEARPPLPWQEPTLVALFLVAPLLFLLSLLGEQARTRLGRETEGTRRRAVDRAARARLDEAVAAAAAEDAPKAYALMSEALLELGSSRSGVALRGLTTEEVGRQLTAHGASAQLAEAVARELEAASYVRFAGVAQGKDKLGSAAERWRELFAQLSALEPKGARS